MESGTFSVVIDGGEMDGANGFTIASHGDLDFAAVEDQREYIVQFHAHLDDAAQAVLDSAGITLRGATGPVTVGPGDERQEPDHHYANVYAPSEAEAAGKVADALRAADVPFTPRGVTQLL